MLAAERARHLAEAIASFPILGPITAGDLLGLVATELGHPQILDDFQKTGGIRSKAVAPEIILHVISGNTPHAGLQSLVRGLLLGAHNRCKIPASGLPEIDAFRRLLPKALAEKVEIESELPETWLRDAGAIIVFGSDETVSALRKKARPHQKFVAHGHRVSFGIIFDKADDEAARLAARDASLFDQQGCLSPHDFYVRESEPGMARRFAGDLAREMEQFNRDFPRRALTPQEASEITHLRSTYQFRATNDSRVQLWCSEKGTDWTVIYEDDPHFAVSPLNRFVFVKPLPADLAPELRLVRRHLSSIAIRPFGEEEARCAAGFGASRICPLGAAQQPSWFWHQDGIANLAPLVDWIDLG